MSSPPLPPLSRFWIREVDRRAIAHYGMSGLVLMENAARGVVEVLLRLGCTGPVLIACGKGNNGGDGLVIARWLDLLAIPVRVLLFADPAELTGDAAVNYRIVMASEIPLTVLPRDMTFDEIRTACGEPEWVLDALLGTGFQGETRPPLSTAIDVLNGLSARRLAIDLPSGLDCDTGFASCSTFRADHTVTFVAPKPGLLVEAAREFVGNLHVAAIGCPRKLIEDVEREARPDDLDGQTYVNLP